MKILPKTTSNPLEKRWKRFPNGSGNAFATAVQRLATANDNASNAYPSVGAAPENALQRLAEALQQPDKRITDPLPNGTPHSTPRRFSKKFSASFSLHFHSLFTSKTTAHVYH